MNILDLPHGFHEGIGADLYHERVLGLINKGALDILDRQTPHHYRHWLTAEQTKDTPAMLLGRAFHALVLQPDVFARTFCEAIDHPYKRPTSRQINAKKPSPESVAAIRYWSEWDSSHTGMVELDGDDMQAVVGMYDAVMGHPLAGPAIANSQHEVVARWVDPRTGIECKAMFDAWMPSAALVPDLKSTIDARASAFARSCANFRYHLQSAHYRAAVKALTGENADMPFIAVEKEPPYAVNVIRLGPDSIDRGDFIRDRALDLLAECLATDTWPGHGDSVTTVELPAYAFYD
jgi:exodeoxyribonuclease VIII